ncbi:Ubiquitin carboxyl-terminal hydrolase 10 [Lithohypha guttulata]|uniref:Ubiquitin carboxyl-terminal hydrolase 10 n=1 Tax=Lithohypha guttulata TaxID=1690604 RepID=UPI002DE1B810|nr:Ubiquitin carboxyl-terminal hydrolase 10 [Lithohypha guttulata]KAK5099396.1 Ubiquitin carboxyl-terminal hydrolase 10 [Lithohypha guttulata]
MSKRKSVEPHEVAGSPASKRARVEDDLEDVSAPHPRQNGLKETNHTGKTAPDADDDFDSDEEYSIAAPTQDKAPLQGYGDLYLDTINRSVLDFDFEKLCSVTLSNINVYACLVCGKYFQGRGMKSYAYFHALDEDHHVYINMETKKVYVLPEGYEVLNRSLDDIKYVIDPKFTEEDVKKLDKVPFESVDLSNKRYRPGFIGMNNIKANDYLNVVVQTLSHVAPIRNFLLLHDFPQNSSQLAIRLSTLVRKIWNTKAFRNHVSPHELIQEIAIRSSKKFTLTQQSDPVDFISWFLNSLHVALGGSKTKPLSSIIQRTFQGKIRIETQAIRAVETGDDRLRFEESSQIDTKVSPYMILTLDLPPIPLFRDSVESKNIIPQVALTTLLQKYGGLQTSEKANTRVRHRLLHPLPPYIIFHIKRFSVNKFVSERNPTIVTFPSPRGLDMSPYVEPNPEFASPSEPIIYEMVSNIILDAATGKGGGEDSNAADAANRAVGGEGEKVMWKVQVRDKAAADVAGTEQGRRLPEWREIQDLYVERAEAETLFTREGYLMVWERKTRPRIKEANGSSKGKTVTR